MKSRKTFLLRISPDLFAALEAWAQREFRSVNGQIEYLLREAVRRCGQTVSAETESDAPEDAARAEDRKADKSVRDRRQIGQPSPHVGFAEWLAACLVHRGNRAALAVGSVQAAISGR